MKRTRIDGISGIYQLFSFKNEKRYIGSAVDLKRRKAEHFKKLQKSKHENYKLQNHVDEYGVSDLLFSVLEFCSKSRLIEQEQYWVNLLNPEFNICKHIANSVLGLKWKVKNPRKGKEHPMYGKHLTEDHIKCISKSQFELWKDPEYKIKMKEAHKGQVPWNKGKTGIYSKETKRKMGDATRNKKWSKKRRDAEIKK